MFENLKNIMSEELGVSAADITMETEFTGDLGLNSLELIQFVYACEQKFDVEIDEADLQSFITVGDVVRYLESKV